MPPAGEVVIPDLERLKELFREGAIDRRCLVVAAFVGHAPSAQVLGKDAPPRVEADSAPGHSLGPYTDGWTVDESLHLGMFFARRFRPLWEAAWDENSRVRREPDLFEAPGRAMAMIEAGEFERFQELRPSFTRLSDHSPFDEPEILGQRYGDGVASLAEAVRDGEEPYMGSFWFLAEKQGIAEMSPEISAEMMRFAFSQVREA